MRALVISGGGSKELLQVNRTVFIGRGEAVLRFVFRDFDRKLAHFSPSSGKSRNHKRSIYPSQSIQHL